MNRLKTLWIVLANVALMAAILAFVALYSNHEREKKTMSTRWSISSARQLPRNG